MYQLQTYGKHYDFRWLEERLLALGFCLVFCTRTPESFESARKERLKVSGKPSQYDDLQVFVSEQELMQQLAKGSILPKLTVDISDNDVPRAVEHIADWLEETGGLYMRD
jgi:transcriptional/translational regulatory protein YebC/TACO1